MQQTLTPLTTVKDVQRIEGYVKGLLRRGGQLVNGAKETPISGEFLVPPWSLTSLVDGIGELFSPEERASADEEFELLRDDINFRVDAATITGRTASVPDADGFQHFLVRDGALYHILHVGELDLARFFRFFYVAFRAQKYVVDSILPKGFDLKRIQLRLNVDALYTPVEKKAEEPATTEVVL